MLSCLNLFFGIVYAACPHFPRTTLIDEEADVPLIVGDLIDDLLQSSSSKESALWEPKRGLETPNFVEFA